MAKGMYEMLNMCKTCGSKSHSTKEHKHHKSAKHSALHKRTSDSRVKLMKETDNLE